MPDVREGPTSDRHDQVELALLQAHELIESTVLLHRNSPASGSLVMTQGDDQKCGAVVERVLSRARRSLCVALPGDAGNHPESLRAGLATLAEAGRRGVTVRVLCPRRLLGDAEVVALGRHAADCEVRVVQSELLPAVIVDGWLALVRPAADRVQGSPDRTHGSLAVFQDPAAVRGMDLLFAGAWGSAVRMAECLKLHECLRTEYTQRILERLCAGRKDDVAAREIKVSLRTYRRHVAEIMRVLGASSRFQAGVRAVELGLLPVR